jgi:hypothetical protein
MAPSLQERFSLRKKKNFDAFDDSSYKSEESGDLDAPAGSDEPYVSSLEPTEEEPEEDKEQAPLPPPPPLTNERAPSVLGRLLGKNPSSPRKSSKNSFQSSTSKLTKQTQSNPSADIASTPVAVAEDAPQTPAKTPAKLTRKSPKKTKRESRQCKQSLLDDSGSDESLSDDDGVYRPSKEMALMKPNRPKVLAVESEVESSLSVGMGEVNTFSNPSSLEGSSLHDECDRAEFSSSHSRGDQKERRSVLPAPSQESLMDMALACQNEPNTSETTSARPKRRGVRRSNEPQGAQPSSLEDPSLHDECDRVELSSSPSRGDHKERRTVLPAPSQESLMDMALASQNDPNTSETTSARPKRRGFRRPQGAQFIPSLMSADADCESKSVVASEVDDGENLPTPMGRRPSLLSAPSQPGDVIDDGDGTEDDDASESSLPAAPIPDDSNNGGGDETKDDHNSVIESQSVPSPSVVNASAKSKHNSERRPKVPQPAFDPEREDEGSSDEDDDGYLPTSMASSKSSRPAILSVLSQSSLTGDIIDNGDHNKDNQSSEPSPLADQSHASLDCSLSDLGPDRTYNGEDSDVFSLSALEKKNHASPVKSLLKAEGDDSTSKLDSSLQGLSMAFEDREGGSQSNLFLAKIRQNKVKGPGEVDQSVRSSRSSLSFSDTVDPNGETQSINVDTRLPAIESPIKETRGHNIRGDNKIADMSDIDEPSFASKSTENSSRHSQRSGIASPKKQPREPPQIDLSEQESRSPPRQGGSPRRQHLQQEHHSSKSPKTSRPSKSQSLHQRSQSAIPVEDVSKTGPSSEQVSMSQHTRSSPRRKMMKSKGDARVHPGPLVGDIDFSQTDQGREKEVSTRAEKSEHVEENVSPTSVEGFSPPRRQQRKVTSTTTPKVVRSRNLTQATTPKAASSRNLTQATTPKAASSSDLFKASTPNPSSSLFKATTPNARATSGLGKATTPNPRSSRRTPTTPRRAQTPRGTSSSRNVDKSSDSYKKFIRQMGNSGNIGDLCSLREDEETSSRNLVPESPQNVKNRPSEYSERTSSLRNLIAESPRKTSSSMSVNLESPRKANSSRSVNPESPRRATSSRNLNPESPRRATSSRNLNPESPRRATSMRNLNPESPRRATSSRNLNPESPRRATSSRNLNPESQRRATSSRNPNPESPRRTTSSRNQKRASLQKAGSSRNVKTASPLNAGRDLLKRAQSSRIMPSSDWNYEPNRRHVTPASEDDPDNRGRDANKTSSQHLRIPSIDIC